MCVRLGALLLLKRKKMHDQEILKLYGSECQAVFIASMPCLWTFLPYGAAVIGHVDMQIGAVSNAVMLQEHVGVMGSGQEAIAQIQKQVNVDSELVSFGNV